MKKTTWFVLGAFALLLAAFLVLQNIEKNKEPVETPVPTSQPTLRSLDDQDISQIDYTDSLGEDIQFVHEDSLMWTSPTHPASTITAGNIEELIANLSELNILSTLSNTTSPEDLGLANPNAVVVFTFTDGSTYKLEIGNPTPMGDGYYVRIDGIEIVVLPYDSIEQVATSFLTLTQTPTPEPEITETTTPTDENGD
jgi:hypothetical protein